MTRVVVSKHTCIWVQYQVHNDTIKVWWNTKYGTLLNACVHDTHIWMHIYLHSSPAPLPPPFYLPHSIPLLSSSLPSSFLSPPCLSPPCLSPCLSPSLYSLLPLFTPSSLYPSITPSFPPSLPSSITPTFRPSLPPLSTDPYVKVYILHKDKKHDKWKSTVKWNTLLPIFNEPFQFDISNLNVLDLSLEFVVMDYDRFSKDNVVGQVLVGPNAKDEMGQTHWEELISNPNQPISRWHAIYPASEDS